MSSRRMLRGAAAVLILAAVLVSAPARAAEIRLNGVVIDAETGKPVPYVAIALDRGLQRFSSADGLFDFGWVAGENHVLVFEHVAYKTRTLAVSAAVVVPMRVLLEPSPFAAEGIIVEGQRTFAPLPVGAVALERGEVTNSAGNVANDPLRTVQAQPSCAADGIDLLSRTAVRGGDTEEHRVYFDGYPLAHYAHTGGFANVIYDDMVQSTVLVPGGAPIRYGGALSGIISMSPVDADTSFRSFRYDLTSMAVGVGQTAGASLSLQAAAKSSFFNLPVYQQPGVQKRSFGDLLGRVVWSPGPVTATATLLAAQDTETQSPTGGLQPERQVNSLLAGVHVSHRRDAWRLGVRPYYSLFDSRDAVTAEGNAATHELQDARLTIELDRRGRTVGLGLFGEVGSVRHTGNGGTATDTPFSASLEGRLLVRDAAAVVIGVGGAREPWTRRAEPEAYASVRVDAADLVTVSGGYRRSHQSPFIFTERRYFASLPIDAGDLLAGYAPTWSNAPAVEMDQVSVDAAVSLPMGFSAAFNGFQRWYRNLLTWQWDSFPAMGEVASNGDGHGLGYEIVLTENIGFLSATASIARARIWKREGTLDAERLGDFDRPRSWQLGAVARVGRDLRLSVRWMDVDGRPYTHYNEQTTAPPTEQVNAVRLPAFRRLDFKIVYGFDGSPFQGEAFLDVINCLNEPNIAAIYALPNTMGELVSVPYGGTRLFPIGGITVRW